MKGKCALSIVFALMAPFFLLTAHPEGSAKSTQFHDSMRKLWEDHITWTRLFIVSAAADLPDKTATTDRQLQNQSTSATRSSHILAMQREKS